MKQYKVFHGGYKLDHKTGYQGAKKGRIECGVGLYTTNSYDRACLYAKGIRKVYELHLNLDINDCTAMIRLNKDQILREFISTTPKSIQRKWEHFCERWDHTDSIALSTLDVFLTNCNQAHKYAKELNAYMVSKGGKFSMDNSEVRIHDFSVITHCSAVINDYEASMKELDVLRSQVTAARLR